MALFLQDEFLNELNEVDRMQLWLADELVNCNHTCPPLLASPNVNSDETQIDVTMEPVTQTLLVLPSQENIICAAPPRHFHLEKYMLKQLTNEDLMNNRGIKLKWQSCQAIRHHNRVKTQM